MRSKIKKSASCIALALVLFASGASFTKSDYIKATSSVSELEDKINDIKERNDQIDSEMDAIDGSISENEDLQALALEKLTNAKEQLDYWNNLLYYKNEEISAKQDEIDTLDLSISAKEKDISAQEDNISKLEQENELNLKSFGDIMHAMYISGNIDILSVLSDSADMYDLLINAKMVTNIYEQNLRFMNELKQSISDAETMKAQLQSDIDDLNELKLILVSEKEALELDKLDLEDSQAEAQALAQNYKDDYNYYTNAIVDAETQLQNLQYEKTVNTEEIEAYENKLQEIIRQAQQNSQQQYEAGEWMWPVETQYTMITTWFGYDSWRNGNHSGIDISGGNINWSNVYASKGGTVIKANHNYIEGYSYGKYIVIDHGDGYSTLYGHLNDIYVSEGQYVSQGEVIGAVGSTGFSTGPHLHFEVRINGTAQDPFNYVNLP